MLREALTSVEQARNANVIETIIVDDGSSKSPKWRLTTEF
jgi:glycosyltransferase involved in cell wall biosynthesis